MESVRLSVAAVHDRVTAHLDAFDDATLVDQLRTLLGARLVAYLAGAQHRCGQLSIRRGERQ